LSNSIVLDGIQLTVYDLVKVCRERTPVSLDDAATTRMMEARATVDRLLETGGVYYGINTGFGALADKRVKPADLAALQVDLVRSHAVGVQESLPTEIVRGMMALRLNTFAKGHSGVSAQVAELLLSMLNGGLHPIVPAKGSVGASGDLAPLAHVAITLLGEGRIEFAGEILAARDALAKMGLMPAKLRPKDGLALINGTQLMTAIGALAVYDLETIAETAELVSACAIQVLRGSPDAYDSRMHNVRPQAGQVESARNMRELTAGSSLLSAAGDSVEAGQYPQDPYSIRCVPQVMGAVRDTIRFAKGVIETEMNSANDNPLVFPDDGCIISGGNFHGQPIAFVLDFLAIAACSVTNLAERQVYRMLDERLSNGLPPFLMLKGETPGLASGLMAAQYSMAALASENKVLAHPASVDTIPTSADYEDFVSMGPIAGLKLRSAIHNCMTSLAIALIAVSRAADFRGVDKLSEPCRRLHERVRVLLGEMKKKQMGDLVGRLVEAIPNRELKMPR